MKIWRHRFYDMCDLNLLIAVCILTFCVTSAAANDCKTYCGEASCCEVSLGNVTCCKHSNGVCCENGRHCCPQGTSCGMFGLCNAEGLPNPISGSLLYVPPSKKILDVICPDRTSKCPDSTTCCSLKDNSYGCCPLPEAVCCRDHVHCCPKGTVCDPVSKGCSAPGSPPSVNLQPTAHADEHLTIVCPDSKYSCPNNTTCCEMQGGTYGCCPFPKAVCCADKLHCCPDDTTCSVDHEQCESKITSPIKNSVPWAKKTSAIRTGLVVCPDGRSTCAQEETCCQQQEGAWGCCPMLNAVCCEDREHCCPEKTRCDVSGGMCIFKSGLAIKQTGSSSHLLSLVAPSRLSSPVNTSDNICPDHASKCDNQATCCQLKDGTWGCCPMRNAVCCADHEHCCPESSICDTARGRCIMDAVTQPLPLAVMSANLVDAGASSDTICPDHVSKCDGSSTCCRLQDGSWGCCPLPQAICCNDGLHCCPKHSICNVSTMSCDLHDMERHRTALTTATRLPASRYNTPTTICPDGLSHCPAETTCCAMATGTWGCCPMLNATCCSDGSHCCPNGYACVLGRCIGVSGSLSVQVPWSKKQPAKKSGVVVCPDGGSFCPDETTCCLTARGVYACCPLPRAVCCDDKVHCCPENTICDLRTQSCLRSNDKKALAMVSTSNVTQQAAVQTTDVVCPNNSTYCPDDSTCCKMSTNSWGCCPESSAVCCEDGMHCCPEGYGCRSDGRCYKPGHWLPSITGPLIKAPSAFDATLLRQQPMPLAKMNILLILPYYRAAKQYRHNICGDSYYYCAITERCSPLPHTTRRYNEVLYCCLPHLATACLSSPGSFCPEHFECDENATCRRR